MTSAIESAITCSATAASSATVFGRADSAAPHSRSFADICASQLSPPLSQGNNASSTTSGVIRSQKPIGLAMPAGQLGTRSSIKNSAPSGLTAGLSPFLPALAPVAAPPNTLPDTATQKPSTGLSSSSMAEASANTGLAGTLPDFAELLPTPELWASAPLSGVSPAAGGPMTADQRSGRSAATQADLPGLSHPEEDAQSATVSATNSRGLTPTVVSTPQAWESIPKTAVAGSSAAVRVASFQTADSPAGANASASPTSPARSDSLPSADSTLAEAIPFQAAATAQTDSDGVAQVVPADAEGLSIPSTTPDDAEAESVFSSAFFSPLVQPTEPQQRSVNPPTSATSSTSQPTPSATQNLASALRPLVNNPMAAPAFELRQTVPQSDSLPTTQSSNQHTGPSVISRSSPSANGSEQEKSNAGSNSLPTTPAEAAAPPLTAMPTPAAMSATKLNNSQSGSSSIETPDPHKAPLAVSGPTATSPAASSQPPSLALVDPATQGTTSQHATPSSTDRSDPAGSPVTIANLPASGELPVTQTTGPVQLAQIVNKAAQAEMRIGMNTSAFGNVEVRTVVHANEVGVLIGSEKGDLRSLLANELPNIANTLQQQNLRLNQVNFHQGLAFSNNMHSGGGDSQARTFVPRSAPSLLPPSIIREGETLEPGETSIVRPLTGSLSILA